MGWSVFLRLNGNILHSGCSCMGSPSRAIPSCPTFLASSVFLPQALTTTPPFLFFPPSVPRTGYTVMVGAGSGEAVFPPPPGCLRDTEFRSFPRRFLSTGLFFESFFGTWSDRSDCPFFFFSSVCFPALVVFSLSTLHFRFTYIPSYATKHSFLTQLNSLPPCNLYVDLPPPEGLPSPGALN